MRTYLTVQDAATPVSSPLVRLICTYACQNVCVMCGFQSPTALSLSPSSLPPSPSVVHPPASRCRASAVAFLCLVVSPASAIAAVRHHARACTLADARGGWAEISWTLFSWQPPPARSKGVHPRGLGEPASCKVLSDGIAFPFCWGGGLPGGGTTGARTAHTGPQPAGQKLPWSLSGPRQNSDRARDTSMSN